MSETVQTHQSAGRETPAALIDAFIAQCVCEKCGSVPAQKTMQLDSVQAAGGLWILAGYACSACHHITVAKQQVCI